MQLPDITDLLYDPDVGGNQPFIIKRTTVTRRKGRYADSQTQSIKASGSVQPAGTNALEQLPEGDRDKGVYIVRTRTAMYMGSETDEASTLADEIIYNGDRYKILMVKEWQAWGMYVAYMTRIQPAEAQQEGG